MGKAMAEASVAAFATRSGSFGHDCIAKPRDGVFAVAEVRDSEDPGNSRALAGAVLEDLGSLAGRKDTTAVEAALLGAHWTLRKRSSAIGAVALLIRSGDDVVAAQSGDAAVYLLRRGRARSLFRGQDALVDGKLRRGIGAEGDFEADVEKVEVEDEDVFLLATAEVARHLQNGDVSVLVDAVTEESLRDAARRLLRDPGGIGDRGGACQVIRMRRNRTRRISTGRSNGLRWAGATHCGLRSRNEDAMLLASPTFALADGMGGMADGALAARLAIEQIAEGARADGEGRREWLERVSRLADDAVWRRLGGEGGSTLDVLHVDEDGVHIAHVGDGRVYRVREVVEQMTEDHNVAAQLARQGLAGLARPRDHHTVTQALGTGTAAPDLVRAPLRASDRWVLATDGLDGVEPARIGAILRAWDRDLGRACRELIDEALRAGGTDNVTVVIVAIDDDGKTGGGDGRRKRVHREPRDREARGRALGRGSERRRRVPHR